MPVSKITTLMRWLCRFIIISGACSSGVYLVEGEPGTAVAVASLSAAIAIAIASGWWLLRGKEDRP